jgi:soluble lytic murein transglycosylase-like protein
VSDKAAAIADRLEGSGYYRRLSRAYRGYPHLRSKRAVASAAPAVRALGFNASARRALQSSLATVARTENVDPKLMDAVIIVESGYNADAVSPKGAMGLMQLMPATAERFGVAEPFDPTANMRGGARYLRWLIGRFDGELSLVLAAYNAGEGAVAAHGHRIPPYRETQQYVQRVLQRYRMSAEDS